MQTPRFPQRQENGVWELSIKHQDFTGMQDMSSNDTLTLADIIDMNKAEFFIPADQVIPYEKSECVAIANEATDASIETETTYENVEVTCIECAHSILSATRHSELCETRSEATRDGELSDGSCRSLASDTSACKALEEISRSSSASSVEYNDAKFAPVDEQQSTETLWLSHAPVDCEIQIRSDGQPNEELQNTLDSGSEILLSDGDVITEHEATVTPHDSSEYKLYPVADTTNLHNGKMILRRKSIVDLSPCQTVKYHSQSFLGKSSLIALKNFKIIYPFLKLFDMLLTRVVGPENLIPALEIKLRNQAYGLNGELEFQQPRPRLAIDDGLVAHENEKSKSENESLPCAHAPSNQCYTDDEPCPSLILERHDNATCAQSRHSDSNIQSYIENSLNKLKSDLLQDIKDVVSGSVKRCVLPQEFHAGMRTVLKAQSSTNKDLAARVVTASERFTGALDEVVGRIELAKAESVGCTMRMGEIVKEQMACAQQDLEKRLSGKIDRQSDVLENWVNHLNVAVSSAGDDIKALLKRQTKGGTRKISFQSPGSVNVPNKTLPIDSVRSAPDKLPISEELSNINQKVDSLAFTITEALSKKPAEYTDNVETRTIFNSQQGDSVSLERCQTETLGHLHHISNQLSLQTHAVNRLVTVANPLAEQVRHVSYDTNLIDAKLAKNAALLNAIDERSKSLESAAAVLGNIVEKVEWQQRPDAKELDEIVAKIPKITSTTSTGPDTVEQLMALKDQMSTMQSQMDSIYMLLNRLCNECTGNSASAPSKSRAPPAERVNNTTDPEPCTCSVQRSTSLDPSHIPLFLTFIIDATFEASNNGLIAARRPFEVAASSMSSIACIILRGRPSWARDLAARGITTARMELISIGVPGVGAQSSRTGPVRRILDNELAYRGWFEKTGQNMREGSLMICLEFINCPDDFGRYKLQRKKRKQDEMEAFASPPAVAATAAGVEFSTQVWRNAKQTEYK